MAIKLTVNTNETAVLGLSAAEQVGLTAEATTYIDRCTIYEGPTDWTPTNAMQTIEIEGKKALQNITINPIPSNYGLITWNGSTLTVS